MKRRRFSVYGWCCEFLIGYDSSDIDEVIDTLDDCGAPEELLEEVTANLLEQNLNEGFTFVDFRNCCITAGIGIADSGEEFLNTFTHELRHLVDEIAYAEGLPSGGEGVAYLTGNITLGVADLICEYTCNHCRRH